MPPPSWDEDDDDTPLRRPRLTDSQRERFYLEHPPGTPVTDERRPKRLQTSNERDLVSDRDRRRRTPAAGVPTERDQEHTDPLSYMVEPNQRDIEAFHRAGRDTDSPVKVIEFAAALSATRAVMRAERQSAEEAQFRRLDELLKRAPRDTAEELMRRFEDVESKLAELDKLDVKKMAGAFSLGKKLMAWLIPIAVGGLGTGIGAIVTRASNETASRMEIEYLKEKVGRLERIAEERRSSTPYFPPLPTTKGP